MSEYTVKIGFWLRAYDGFSVEAESDAEAIEKAKGQAKSEMESLAQPEHIDWERREGVIVFIDRISDEARAIVAEDLAFDDDWIDRPAQS
jgi:hypothetical protein